MQDQVISAAPEAVARAHDEPTARRVIATEAEDVRAPSRALSPDPAPVEDVQADSLAALFSPELAGEFRTHWDAIQIGFVDDPEQAVRDADALVGRALKSLEETFAGQRDGFQEAADPAQQGSTENLRVALRRYRSFFHRLLTL